MKYIIPALVLIPATIQAADYESRRTPQQQIFVQPETMTQQQYQYQYDSQYGEKLIQPVQQPAYEAPVDDAYSQYRGYPTQQIEQPVYPAFEQEIPDEIDEQDIDFEASETQDIQQEIEVQTEEKPSLDRNKATLQILDKISAKAKSIEVSKDDITSFHSLDISLKRCLSAPKSAKEENLAYLEIVDNRSAVEKTLFRGWMFSSNPALNSLQHPLYDVVLLSCDGDEKTEAAE